MHILHLIDSLAVGGAERMLVDIANASVDDHYRISVCTTRSEGVLAQELRPEIERLPLRRARRFDRSALQTYDRFVRQKQVDMIHAHGRSSFSFAAFAKLLYRNAKPVILHDHYGIEIDPHIPRWFRLWGKHYVSKYIGVYEKLGAWAREAGVHSENVFVIGNGIDLKRFQSESASNLKQELGINPQTPLGLVIAGLRAEKGIDLLIESLARCRDLDFKILIVGGERDHAYVQRCKELALTAGVADRLIFWGERPDIPRITHSVDFALMPSRSESGPLVLIEEMAAGLPFVSFRVGDVSHQAAGYGVQGFVEPNDTAAFAAALTNLLSLSDLERRQRGQFAQSVSENHFSIQAKMPAFYEVYQRASLR